jgi:hypothetical protein
VSDAFTRTKKSPLTVEELLARAQIHDALLRYCRGLDRVDMALVRSAFHDDAWIDFPESLHIGGVAGFFDFLSAEMPRFDKTMHLLGNSLVDFDGPRVAHVETYLNADHQGSERHHWAGQHVKLWGRYLDRFEERDGVWLIARRRLVVDLMYRYPADGWFDDHPDASGNSRDGSDPALRPTAGFTGTPVTAADNWPAT